VFLGFKYWFRKEEDLNIFILKKALFDLSVHLQPSAYISTGMFFLLVFKFNPK